MITYRLDGKIQIKTDPVDGKWITTAHSDIDIHAHVREIMLAYAERREKGVRMVIPSESFTESVKQHKRVEELIDEAMMEYTFGASA